MFKHFVILFVMVLAFASCTSEEERQERRENAFDLSGNYVSSIKTGSEVNMSIDIYNENGRHDIYAEVERSSSLSSKEIELLGLFGISRAEVEGLFFPHITLGKNTGGWQIIDFDGGENISSDFGESTHFTVCSNSQEVRGKRVANSSYTKHYVYYCLSGEVNKRDYALSGRLRLHVSRESEETRIVINAQGVKTNERYTSTTFDSINLEFKTDSTSIFYNQLKGTWSGVVINAPDVDADFSSFRSLQILFDSNTYFLIPNHSKTISFRGEKYVYKETQSEINGLRDAIVPLVEMHFVNRSGSRRLIMAGQIFSLGSFTGSVILNDEESPEGIQLASFELKKD